MKGIACFPCSILVKATVEGHLCFCIFANITSVGVPILLLLYFACSTCLYIELHCH